MKVVQSENREAEEIPPPKADAVHEQPSSKETLWRRFMNYCEGQDKNRVLWLGIVMVSNGCILVPMVMMVTLLTGPHFILMSVALVVMGLALIANLAGLPTKLAIPAFALSVFMDAAIVITCALAVVLKTKS